MNEIRRNDVLVRPLDSEKVEIHALRSNTTMNLSYSELFDLIEAASELRHRRQLDRELDGRVRKGQAELRGI